ncbi:hypothetical protein AKJ44_02725 [candidate division MSBL1 archaeon SCGC-AAA261F17]|uniref:DUF488 domain-containing protein n=1 Tax=candidate division MSBL1 archaeon SCGC-AAA261F17 TaxID=1698274 RepID=A0A133V4C0_9EURY|nr:hypothetical protein AKJ44_02725 [candidate division MSBL1 archaeon SCGC-AAA261F17]
MKIYTIGYGDKEFKELVKLLKRIDIKQVVDVRSFPKSKWPEYEKESLQKTLPEQGIEYVHLRELGGYRDGGYENYMETKNFQKGLDKLIELAQKQSTVIMCLESYPNGCHRRFISQKLSELGWEVIHLVGKKGKQRTL